MTAPRKYANDVFISYGQIDNRPEPGIPDSCWVTNLRTSLQIGLDQRLGRGGSAKIWMDLQGLQGNASVTPEIHSAIASSAVLLIVLSEGSLHSPWCQQEWQLFQEAAGGAEGLAGRVFIVLPDELPMDRWPKAFQDRIGYRFFTQTPENEIVRLGKPRPAAEQKDYFSQLERLRKQLTEQLVRMQTAVETPAALTPKRQGGVFVAETSADLEDERDQLLESLKNAGHAILPERFYDRAPAEFRTQMTNDLAGCELYVQMLGARATRCGDAQSYEGLQAEIAREVLKDQPDRLLFWRSPSADPAKAKFADHRALLENPLTKVMDLEELKSAAVKQLQRFRDKVERPVMDGNRLVLIHTTQQDRDVADQLIAELQAADIDFDVIFDDKSVVDVARATGDVHGLLVLYGKAREDWVADQVRQMRSLVLEKKTGAPRCAVYFAAPEPKTLLVNFKQLVRIDNKDRFAGYLAEVVAGGGAG